MSLSSQLSVRHFGTHYVLAFTDYVIAGDTFIVDHQKEIELLADTELPRHVTFDLTGLVSISSSSLSVLFGLYKRGIQVSLFNPSPTVVDVLEVTQLQEVFPSVESLPTGEEDDRTAFVG